MFTIYFLSLQEKIELHLKTKKNHEKSGTGRHCPAAGAARHMDYGTSPNELDKKNTRDENETETRKRTRTENGLFGLLAC